MIRNLNQIIHQRTKQNTEKSRAEVELEKYLITIYRFCDNPSQVNWDARRQIDSRYYQDIVLPGMYNFLEKVIKTATYRRTKYMNALIGLSGGLDSTTAAYIVAEAMQRSIELGKTQEANLGLISFIGLEDNKTQAIAENLQNRYQRINVRYQEQSLEELIKINERIRILVKKLKTKELKDEKELEIFGELIPRLIAISLNETADRTGYASINTTNGTEYILGEFTVGIGYDVGLFSGLYKSSVFTIGEILGIPGVVLDANPVNSAFSFTNKPKLYFGETPENITSKQVYEVLDPVLYWIHEQKKTSGEISEALGHSESFVKKVRKRIRAQKHRQTIPVFLVESKRKFFPNRTPISNKEAKRIIKQSMLPERF